MLKKGRGLTHARKTAAKAASAATAMELPTVLAAPVKGAMGEPVGCGPVTLNVMLETSCR